MAEYVTKIRTESGDKQIDYNALANLPQTDATLTKSGAFADAKAVGDAINAVIGETSGSIAALAGAVKSVNNIKADGSGNVALDYSDVGALPSTYVAPVTSVNGHTGNVSLTPEDIGAVSLDGGVMTSPLDAPTLKEGGVPLEKKYAQVFTYMVALPASGWSGSSPYTQTVACSDIKATDTPLVDIDMSSATADTVEDLTYAWSLVNRVETKDGGITATAHLEKPEVDMNLIILAIGGR